MLRKKLLDSMKREGWRKKGVEVELALRSSITKGPKRSICRSRRSRYSKKGRGSKNASLGNKDRDSSS